MASKQTDPLWQFLFASDDCSLVNLKLFRGDSNDITAQDLNEQVHSALMQVKTGTAQALDDFPETAEGGQVNVRKLAESL